MSTCNSVSIKWSVLCRKTGFLTEWSIISGTITEGATGNIKGKGKSLQCWSAICDRRNNLYLFHLKERWDINMVVNKYSYL